MDQSVFIGCCLTKVECPKTEEEEIKREKTTNPSKNTHKIKQAPGN